MASLAGNGTVTNTSGTGATLTAGGNSSSTVFSGTLNNGTSTVGLTKTGTGTLSLSGSNTYSGATTVSGGTLQAGSITGLSSGSAFTVNSVLDLDGFSSTVASLAGNGTVTNSSGTGATLTAGGDNSSTVFSGTMNNGTSSVGLTKTGTGTLSLSGSNTYSGGTNLNGGIVAVNGDSNLGTGPLSFNIGTLEALVAGGGIISSKPITLTAGGGTFLADTGTASSLSGVISGAGAFTKNGSGTLGLLGTNTYTGGTTISAGILQIGNGGTSGSIVGNVIDNGALAFNRSDTVSFPGIVSGTGSLSQNGPGTLILTGSSTYTGATAVSVGTLQVNGVLGNTAVTVESGSVLAGQGTIGGSVTIQDGGHLAPGATAQTLGVGSLFLNPASILNYRLSTPGVIGSGVNTLVNVTGNLTLDGILNVTNGGNFASGAYRLINYTGALSDLILGLGTLPAGFTPANLTVTTGVAGQVNLVVSTPGAPTQFWDGSNTVFDGTVHGGTGTWDNFTTNFTNAPITANQSWQNGVAVFSGAPGTVTLGDNILFQGMQFTATGYTVAGSGAFALQPTGTATISTDIGVTATITAPITGPGGLSKGGLGLLSLTGVNTYNGGTTISGGVLQVGSNTNLGNVSGGLILDGGELLAAGSGFTTLRPVLLTANNGTLAAATSGVADFQGNITGSGSLTIGDVVNAGTVDLSGTNSYLGSTTIVNGATLQALTSGALSTTSAFTVAGTLDLNGFSNRIGSLAGTGKVTNKGSAAAVLTAGGAGDTTFSGVLRDENASLGLTKIGTGALFLTGANTYSGGTTISAGSLLIGNGGTTGSIVGNVVDNAKLGFNRQDDVTFSGNVSGTGLLFQLGPGGTLTLTGTNTYSGGTTVAFNSILQVDADTELGAPGGGITLAGGELLTTGAGFKTARPVDLNPVGSDILAAATGTTATYTGVISDSEPLTMGDSTHRGTVVLTGNNSYSGGTTVAGGVLSVADDTNLGNPSGGLTLAGGELATTANFTTARTVTLVPTPSFDGLFAATGTAAIYQGVISGSGALNAAGPER